MPTESPAPDVYAGFINTDAMTGEIKGVLFMGILVLAGFLLFKVMKGDVRSVFKQAGAVVLAVIVVGLAGRLLLSPTAASNVTDTIFNVEPAKSPE